MSSINPSVLYPQVTSIPKADAKGELKKQSEDKGEFGKILGQELNREKPGVDLNQVREPLKFSAHASERIKERNIDMPPEMMSKLNDAVAKAENKGLDDTLVLSSDAAFIVNVPNRTIVTAMDKGALTGNVFTNIDGAIIV